MKVAIYMPSSVPFGGAERRFGYLFSHLSRKNSGSFFLVTNRATFEGLHCLIDSLGEGGGNIFSPESETNQFFIFKALKLKQITFFLRSLLFIREMKITHVHFPVNPSGYAFIFSMIASVMNISMSCSVVNSIKKSRSDLPGMQYFIWKRVIKKSRWIDFLSPSIEVNMKSIFGRLIDKQKTSVSPCSFSYSAEKKFSLQGDFLNIDERKSVDVLFLSRFIRGKGIEILLGALDILEYKKLKMRVVIAGFGELEDLIKTATKDYSYVSCETLFSQNPMGLLEETKIVLSIQQYENYPSQTILEAASCFAAVIATNVGDTPMICNSENSMLIKYDSLDLADAMIKMSRNPELRKRLSLQLYRDVKAKHSVEVFSEYFAAKCAPIFGEG